MAQLAIQIAITAVSTAIQRRQAARAEEARRDSLTTILRNTNSGQPPPILCGEFGVQALLSFQTAGRRFVRPGASTLSAPFGNLQTGDNRRNQYALVQYVLGIGEIQSIDQIIVDDNTDFDDIDFTEQYCVLPTYNFRSQSVSNFRTDWLTARYTGLVKLDGYFQRRRSDVRFHSTPQVFATGRGRKYPVITRTGSPGDYEYTLDTVNRVYSRDMPSLLLDMLVSNDYGPGLSEEQIHLERFYNAIQMARAPTSVAGLGRYEYNGQLQNTRDFITLERRIRSTAPGSYFEESNGRWYISLPGDHNIIPNYVINDNRLVGRLTVTQSGANEALNKIQGKFSNKSKNYAESTAIYPVADSQSATDISNRDGNVRKEQTVNLEGCNSLAQANSVLYTMLNRSRRNHYEFEAISETFVLEQGDVVRLQYEALGINELVIIENKELLNDFNVRFTAVQYVSSDYDFSPGGDEAVVDAPAVNRSLGTPSIVAIPDTSQRTVRINLTPDDDESVFVSNYHYQVEHDGTWLTLVNSAETAAEYNVPTGGGVFRFRARAESQSGRFSPWSPITNTITFGNLSVSGVPGPAGEDGIGREVIYTYTSGATPSNPSNTWGYNSPVSPWLRVDSLTNAQDGEVLWSSSRQIVGQPFDGQSIGDFWSTPVIFSSPGADGDDGNGFEYIYAKLGAGAGGTSDPTSDVSSDDSSINNDGQDSGDGILDHSSNSNQQGGASGD